MSHIEQQLKNRFDDMSDGVCEAIALFQRKDPEPPTALFDLDGLLKSDKLRRAFVLLHQSEPSEHACCVHASAAPLDRHACCLEPTADQRLRAHGEWVLQRVYAEGVMYLAADDRWTPDPFDAGLVRFEEEGMARIFRSWHFRADESIDIARLVVEAA